MIPTVGPIFLTTVTMVSNVAIETKVRSLLYLNNVKDRIYLTNVGKVGELVLSRTSCGRKLG
jgi:hypothetical protein